jgi:hypothetical protein
MKLSEAIRLGAMLKPQGFGSFNTNKSTSCALGAAANAVGITCQELCLFFPILKKRVKHPMTVFHVRRRIFCLIYYLNDSSRWTREQIADWVETIESAQEKMSTESQVLEHVNG